MYIRIKTVNLQNVNTKLKKLKFMIKIDDQGNFGIDIFWKILLVNFT